MMSRILLLGTALADIGVSVLHFPQYDAGWMGVVAFGLVSLGLAAGWRVMEFMLEMSRHQPQEIPLRVSDRRG